MLPVDPSTAADIVVPPLPALSPEDAALKFETMPEAPEQRSIFEDQEPMRFVWSKRWPFLALVPASSVPERVVAPEPVEDAGAVVAEPENAPEPESTTPAQPVAESSIELPPVVPLVAEPAVAEQVPESETTEPEPAIAAEPSTETAPAGDTFAKSVVVDEPAEAAEPVDVVESPVVADEAVVAAVAVALAGEPAEVLREEPTVGETEDEISDDVDAARVNELLDEIEAAEAAENSADVLPVRVDPATSPVVLRISGLSRRFGDTVAVDGIDLDVHEGSFYGIVGPNGAGKTTTLSMVTGLLRPDSGSILVHGVDVWADPDTAKRSIGVLPDRLRLFDRLTGAQLLYYSGILRGLDGATVRSRVKDLARAFGLEDALNRLVTDYSAGMTKKVALAAAMIHSPRLLVLDEPFESVDPVSAANVIEILQKYVAHGGTVVLSSHGMDLIQRVCDHVAIIVNGQVLASGAVDHVRGNGTLEDRFVELAGGRKAAEGMEWLHSFSD